MLYAASLNSGSNANCYYIGNKEEAVLIDAGLSCRETEKRMKQLGLEMEKIKAVFISHEHTDHISGLNSLSRKYGLPVYITDATAKNCPAPPDKEFQRSFEKLRSVPVGGLTIIPFRKSHDANDPYSFVVSGHGIHIGVITDIGYACKKVAHYFSQCHAVFLESNYCPDMLENGTYPRHLKKRISGDKGHLSNLQALELFTTYRASFLNLLILSHLSKNNNRPELVQELFAPHSKDTEIFVASRYEASPVFTVQGKPHLISAFQKPVSGKNKKEIQNKSQLSLFV